MVFLPSHPILTNSQAGAFERELLQGDEATEWAAMQRAGAAAAAALRADLAAAWPRWTSGRALVLIGKGHNGGDAMLAAAGLAADAPALRIDVALAMGDEPLRPLALRAWKNLDEAARGRVQVVSADQLARGYDVIIDGVFGFQFQGPLRTPAVEWLRRVRALPARWRAAIDLPSGLGEPDAFEADATYATGIVKTPLLELPNAGRLRYLDLGFFRGDEPGEERVLTDDVLEPLRRPRPARSDKRTYGHVVVLGGSRRTPGAILMAVQAALRGGAGLVSALVPHSVAASFAATWPEAMWCGCPETAAGGLALEAMGEVQAGLERADTLVIGPGMGREIETLALAKDVLRGIKVPVVIDADALQSDLVWSGSGPRILTPHQGEFHRIAAGAALPDFRVTRGTVTVLKGPTTQLSDGSGIVYRCLGGGPVLARGGSGDMLAGLIGALLARYVVAQRAAGGSLEDTYAAVLQAAAQGVRWHSRAATLLAQERGEVAVRATELLDFLGPALCPR
jgi:ADP-dependent NAD(P)H-hydrate dehydratase / NAD(P)H-hydrate epimerase